MKKLPFVSIVMLNYNGMHYSKQCIPTLKNQTYPKNHYEIVVVDNGSTDDSVEQLKKIKGIKLVTISPNRGFAGGNNAGVRAVKSKYIALVSNDTKLDKNWLLNSMKSFGDKVGVVGSRTLNTGGMYGSFESLGSKLNVISVPISVKTNPFMMPGCAFVFDREKVGLPFDDDYYVFNEDTYVSWLTWIKGYTIKMNLDAFVEHIGGVTIGRQPKLMLFNSEKNRLMNLLIFYEKSTLIKLIPIMIMQSSVNLITSIPLGQFPIRLKSHLWVLRNWKRIMRKRKAIQVQRRRPDREIFKLMTCKMVGVSSIFNIPIKLYCYIVNLRLGR